MQKRRLIGLLLAMALIAVLVLTACGGDDDDDKDKKDPTSAPVATEEVASPVVTEEVVAPVVTEEVAAPVVTEEVAAPVVTEEAPVATEEVAVVATEAVEVAMAPVATEEVAAAATEEVAMAPAATEEVAVVATEEVVAAATEEVAAVATEEPVVAATEEAANGAPLRITLVINGVLGDKSFFDSAQRGMDRLIDEGFNVEVNTIELGITPENWESGLADAMADTENYDLLIVGTYQMAEYLAERAHQYPDKFFVLYDVAAPYEDTALCVEGCTNVYSITYAQNEGSFLAGVYAAAMTTSGLDGTNEDAIIGAIGGQDIPVINDFIVGYEQGACLVNADSQVLVQYAGGWNDPARGKEIALAMYEQQADIIFQIAGGTGVGVFEAAQEQGHYAIGVDSDQASILMDTNPEQAQRILTSMQKNVDNSLYRAVSMYLDGTLPFGQAENLGLAAEGVSLSVNDIYDEFTPDNVKELVDAVSAALANGDITVVSAFGETPFAVGQGCSAMPETSFDVTPFLSGE
jgi:basic membrane protein A